MARGGSAAPFMDGAHGRRCCYQRRASPGSHFAALVRKGICSTGCLIIESAGRPCRSAAASGSPLVDPESVDHASTVKQLRWPPPSGRAVGVYAPLRRSRPAEKRRLPFRRGAAAAASASRSRRRSPGSLRARQGEPRPVCGQGLGCRRAHGRRAVRTWDAALKRGGLMPRGLDLMQLCGLFSDGTVMNFCGLAKGREKPGLLDDRGTSAIFRLTSRCRRRCARRGDDGRLRARRPLRLSRARRGLAPASLRSENSSPSRSTISTTRRRSTSPSPRSR